MVSGAGAVRGIGESYRQLASGQTSPKKESPRRISPGRLVPACKFPNDLHPLHRLRGRLSVICDGSSQLLAGLEYRYGAGSYFHGISGSRIPRHPSLSPADLEGSKSAYLDVVL